VILLNQLLTAALFVRHIEAVEEAVTQELFTDTPPVSTPELAVAALNSCKLKYHFSVLCKLYAAKKQIYNCVENLWLYT